jgi:hypothetical protein
VEKSRRTVGARAQERSHKTANLRVTANAGPQALYTSSHGFA